MPVTSNTDLVVTYDAGGQIIGQRQLSVNDSPAREHAIQCLAVEGLRTLLGMSGASGPLTVEEYNNMDDPTWQATIAAAVARARLNVVARISELSAGECDTAVNLGGNYFEAGYVEWLAGITQQNRVTFTRTGGI